MKQASIIQKIFTAVLFAALGAFAFSNLPAAKYVVNADSGIAVDKNNFPDKNFRKYVSENCDTDGSGYLSDSEIRAVTKMDVSRSSISDMKGIEYFTELERLFCDHNDLTSIDVSKNTGLTVFECQDNELTSIKLSSNISYLSCEYNALTELDLSVDEDLSYFRCEQNQLTSLDVSKNTELRTFYCYANII